MLPIRSATACALLLVFLAVLLPASAGATDGSRTASPDLTGTWACCGGGGAAAQNFVITSGKGALAGKGVLPGGDVFAKITGSVGGDAVTIVTAYNSFAPGYVATFVGTLSEDGGTITGTWTSNRGQGGTWTASRSATGGSIQGRVVDVKCGEQSCKRTAASGVVVTGAGPEGKTASATTNAGGRYKLSDLKAGTWKVKPQGGDFDPDSSSVGVSGSSTGVDFERCVLAATARSKRAPAAGGPLCPPDAIDWLMEKRFTKASVE